VAPPVATRAGTTVLKTLRSLIPLMGPKVLAAPPALEVLLDPMDREDPAGLPVRARLRAPPLRESPGRDRR
jgi:hypothetical protein